MSTAQNLLLHHIAKRRFAAWELYKSRYAEMLINTYNTRSPQETTEKWLKKEFQFNGN